MRPPVKYLGFSKAVLETNIYDKLSHAKLSLELHQTQHFLLQCLTKFK
jgi:hypothetical protein